MRKLLILGAGGYGNVVFELAQLLGCYDKIAFLDDGRSGANVLGSCSEYLQFADDHTEIYPAFGHNRTRVEWLNRLEEEGIPVPTLIHPRAYVSPSARIGAGTVILPMAVVHTRVQVGSGCIVNIGALVDHDCVLEAGVHIAPGAVVKGDNRIPEGMKVESGTVIENREYPL